MGTTERLLSLITASFVHRSVDACIYYIRERINSFPIYKGRIKGDDLGNRTEVNKVNSLFL